MDEEIIQEIRTLAQNAWNHYLESIEGLLCSDIYKLEQVCTKKVFDFPGVYLATSQDDCEIMYVGRTKRNTKGDLTTIKARMQAHKGRGKGRTSDLRNKVGDECLRYNTRAVKVEDDRERLLLEHFLIGALMPKHNIG